MSPLLLVGIFIISTSADVKHVLESTPPNPNSINNLASNPPYWWMSANSPFKAAYDHYKKCSTKNNCLPVNPQPPQPFQTPAIDIKNNPFLSGTPPKSNANYNLPKMDLSKNPFLKPVVTTGNGAVVKDENGFLGVQPAQPFKKPAIHHKKVSSLLNITVECKGEGFTCVEKELCLNGVVNKNGEGLLQVRSDVRFCHEDTEVCCQMNKEDARKSTIKFAGGAGFSPGLIHVQPLDVKPDIVFAGEHGHHSSATSKSVRDVGPSTIDYSDTKFDNDVRFASTFQGPAYLPPIAPTSPRPQPSINQEYVPSKPTTPRYNPPPSPSTPRPLPSTSREYLPPSSTPKPYQPSITPQRPYQPSVTPQQPTPRPYQPSVTPQKPYQPSVTPQRPYQPSSTPQPSYQPSVTTPKPYQPSITPQQPYQPSVTPQRPYQPSVTPQQPTPRPYQPSITPQQPYQPSITPQKPYQPSVTPQPPSPRPYQPSITPQQPYQPSVTPQRPYQPSVTPKPYQPSITPQQPYQPSVTPQRPYQPSVTPQQPTPRPYQPSITPQQPYQPSITPQRPYQPSSPRPTTSREYLPPRPSSPQPSSPRPSPFVPSPTTVRPPPPPPPPRPTPTQPRPTPPPFRPTPSAPTFSNPPTPSYQYPSPSPTQPNPTAGYEYPKPTPTFGLPSTSPRPVFGNSDVNNQYIPPPKKPSYNPDQSVDSANVDSAFIRPTTPRSQYQGELNTAPPQGCAAALKCVQEIYCTAEGVISPVPVVLTKEQELSRVPTTECQDTESGIIGKCCRDPNYKDPWPSANLVNGVDDGQYKEDDSIGNYQPDLQRNIRSHENQVAPQPKCGQRNLDTTPKAQGPLDVNFAEIPWQAMILRDSNRSLLCGGVIIAKNAVLTAAHCIDGIPTNDILIKGGEWKLGIDEEPLPFQVVAVAAAIKHPGYQPGSFVNDLALLVLEEKLRFTKNIGTICLPQPNQIPTENCLVTGWGKRILQLHAKGAIMHSIGVKVMDNQQCQETLKESFPNAAGNYSPNTLCGYSERDQCRVDYGSALACSNGQEYTLSGIFSWDTGCKQPGKQIGGYIAPDVEWIEATLAKPLSVLRN